MRMTYRERKDIETIENCIERSISGVQANSKVAIPINDRAHLRGGKCARESVEGTSRDCNLSGGRVEGTSRDWNRSGGRPIKTI